MKQPSSSVNVEAIAAEVEKLIGQKSGVPGQQGPVNNGNGAPGSQNPIAAFLSSVAQLQQAIPGVNMMQLLQAVSGSQPQMMNSDMHLCGSQCSVPGNFCPQNPDMKPYSQSQMQMNGHGAVPPPPPQVNHWHHSPALSTVYTRVCHCFGLHVGHRVCHLILACRDPSMQTAFVTRAGPATHRCRACALLTTQGLWPATRAVCPCMPTLGLSMVTLQAVHPAA